MRKFILLALVLSLAAAAVPAAAEDTAPAAAGKAGGFFVGFCPVTSQYCNNCIQGIVIPFNRW